MSVQPPNQGSENTAKRDPISSSIDFEDLYTRPAYVTSVTEFISEKNPTEALKFWLREFEDTSSLNNTDDVFCAIDRSIAELDELINDQLNIIIHSERLQKLEASWRGLWYLVTQAEGVKNIKIKVLDISWKEVVRDIDRAMEFDHSQLFNKIYNDEYGAPGGEPYGVLIGDYEISHKLSKRHTHDDIATLKGIAEIAAASFSPFISSASSEMFGLDDFAALGMPLKYQTVFSQNEYINWRALRESTDSRFVGLTLPRILMRLPYRTKPGSYKGLYFYEKPTHTTKQGSTSDANLWGNAAYGFAAILIREFASVGWFGHIRGVPRNQIGGGLLTSLPVDSFDTDAQDIAYKPSTDVVITDAVEREIGDLGFIPLCQCYDTPFCAFYSNQSIQKPQNKDSSDANVNAKLSSMMQHVLCGSRVAHYIKVMIRDKIGSFATAQDCEELLRNWLYKYTTGREDLEWEEQARYPLREASVEVKEHPAKPGQYVCNIHLVPHYQVDQMVSELELVTELAQSG